MSGMFSSTTMQSLEQQRSTQALGSTVSGDSANVSTGHDIALQGSNIDILANQWGQTRLIEKVKIKGVWANPVITELI